MRRSLILVSLLVLTVTPAAAHVNHVSADPQVSPDGTVIVEAVYPAADGWLVLHRDDGGTPGEPIGATTIAGGSFVTDHPVQVDRAVWHNWTDPRRLHVVLHDADGDGRFEPDEDEPRRTFDRLVADDLALDVGPAARVSVEEFSPQTLSDGRVTIRSVSMPADGSLVLRNGSATGGIVGRTTLSAGTHSRVEISVDNAFANDQAETVTLFAGIELAGESQFIADRPIGSSFGVRQAPANGSPDQETATAESPAADGHNHTHGPGVQGHSGGSGPGVGLVGTILALALGLAALLARR